MRRIKLFACLAIMTTLVLGTTVPAFSIDSDGGSTVQEFIDDYANSGGNPEYADARRAEAERFVQNYYADAAIEEQKYNAEHGISSSPVPAAPAPSQPVATPTPVITPNQAAQIQTAQQKALAANPGADPATIYLQTLQANGYTLDATGKIVKLP